MNVQHALTGFSFHFGNSDHYIGRVGLHMGASDPIVSWQDSNQDDPIQWTARYVPVRPNPLHPFERPDTAGVGASTSARDGSLGSALAISCAVGRGGFGPGLFLR
ncbi:MAG: hypothetical protein HZY74_05990 [Brevundimonas sp.]|nr:MAG: hypothetical protein HZY74_05990 [Brevundimonas sp.]